VLVHDATVVYPVVLTNRADSRAKIYGAYVAVFALLVIAVAAALNVVVVAVSQLPELEVANVLGANLAVVAFAVGCATDVLVRAFVVGAGIDGARVIIVAVFGGEAALFGPLVLTQLPDAGADVHGAQVVVFALKVVAVATA